MLLTKMSMKKLEEKLRKAQHKVAEILMEIRDRERKRLTNLGKPLQKRVNKEE